MATPVFYDHAIDSAHCGVAGDCTLSGCEFDRVTSPSPELIARWQALGSELEESFRRVVLNDWVTADWVEADS